MNFKIKELRTIIGREALRTPGVYYHSNDLGQVEEENFDIETQKSILNSLLMIASQVPKTLDSNQSVDCSFTGLNKKDIKTGDWVVTVLRSDIECTQEMQTPDYIQEYDEKDLRTNLGEWSNLTPKTIYIDAEFGGKFTNKTTHGGDVMNPLTQGAMMFANALSGKIEVNETLKHAFILVPIGAEKGIGIYVEATFKGFNTNN
jgi:hypothetical protein